VPLKAVLAKGATCLEARRKKAREGAQDVWNRKGGGDSAFNPLLGKGPTKERETGWYRYGKEREMRERRISGAPGNVSIHHEGGRELPSTVEGRA